MAGKVGQGGAPVTVESRDEAIHLWKYQFVVSVGEHLVELPSRLGHLEAGHWLGWQPGGR